MTTEEVIKLLRKMPRDKQVYFSDYTDKEAKPRLVNGIENVESKDIKDTRQKGVIIFYHEEF